MQDNQELLNGIKELMHNTVYETLDAEAYGEICRKVNVSKMYYDIALDNPERYRDQTNGKLIIADEMRADKIILYDNGEETGLTLTYPYYYGDIEYVHAFIEFPKGVSKEDLDLEVYQMMADLIYVIVSRKNMRQMLDFAEISDPMTGIPNVVYIKRRYAEIIKEIPAEEVSVLFINLRNFKYINEVAGSKAGDEAMVSIAKKLLSLVDVRYEACCRLGGDNFVMLIRSERMEELSAQLRNLKISDLESAPNQVFKIACWVGVSDGKTGKNGVSDGKTGKNRVSITDRLNEAAAACNIGKGNLKKDIVYYDGELVRMMGDNRKIVAIFKPAVKNQEFIPYFQAKVDMTSGELVGFEALCRWIHKGEFIYPDRFIPVLDKEGLIHELDMAIFSATCKSIRSWKDMGYKPPRVSSNFSRKNLYVPDIEEKMISVIREHGLETSDVEVEITESVREADYERLIEFVGTLKKYGVHISIDDFGTGYSSLSLIHNIDADAIKIDKSFVDEVISEGKARILIESIISIANRLKMSVIAEGVETADQGRTLIGFGCNYAQGYYYSKPVDFETATGIVANPSFEPIGMAAFGDS
ncbi:MAG: bifunctional diguanylate cyclase/phosphodiesterase [Lachnospiraceae bacterium]|nr:bifunctional diguanylate cyclase/phosphodiesterase [Lachnospiraceae bacterium]